MERDKVQEVILGASLMEPSAFNVIRNVLKPNDFEGWHRYVFEAMLAIDKRGESADLLTVNAELTKLDKLKLCGNAYAIASLTLKIAGGGNIETHAKLLRQYSTVSKAERLASYIVSQTQNENTDTYKLIEGIKDRLVDMEGNVLSREPRLLVDIMEAELEERKSRTGDISGTPTGLTDWDRIIGGLYNGVHIVAARPAMGKTAFLVTCAINASNNNVPVCIWSGEMTADKVYLRVESNISGVPTERLRLNRVQSYEQENVDFAQEWTRSAQIEVDDTPNLNLADLRIKALNWKHKYGKFILMLDYLGLMEDNGDEYKGVTYNSKRLHQLSNELEIPILLLHQLSRNVETRPDKVPQLSDLRASGQIEQDANTVTFLYRPEYYKLETDPIDGGIVEEGKSWAIIKKNREGMTGAVSLRFEGVRSRFVNF